MGKTPVPLIIWCDPALGSDPSLDALEAKGHTIVRGPIRLVIPGSAAYRSVDDGGDEPVLYSYYVPDLILSPIAHAWDTSMWAKPAFLEAAVKAARARRKAAK